MPGPAATTATAAAKSLCFLAAAVALGLPCPAAAQRPAREPLSVAAASSLKLPIEEAARAFEADNAGVTVAVTLGASGAFFAQIQQGAPVDLFLSADREYPRKLVEAGLAAPGGDVVYGVGRLVAWVPKGSTVDLERRGLAALADPSMKRLAIANPRVAPWGRAAEAALRSAGILDAVRERLVLGQSVAQAAQFASTGAADAALIPVSLTFAAGLGEGRTLAVPQAAYPPQEQSAVVVAASPRQALARDFLSFLTGPKGRAILERYGYALP